MYAAFFILRYNSNGAFQWALIDPYTSCQEVDKYATDIIDDGNNIYLSTKTTTQCYSDFIGCGIGHGSIMKKINSLGKSIWESFQYLNEISDITFDNNNNLIAAGTRFFPQLQSPGFPYSFVTKLDPANGNTIWESAFDSAGYIANNYAAYAVACDSKNNIYLTAKNYDSSKIFRYSSNGKLIGYKALDPGVQIIEADRQGMVIDANDNICLLTYKYANSKYTWFISRYNANGNTGWTSSFDTTGIYKPAVIRTDANGNIIVCGNGTNSYTLKYNSAGKRIWINAYAGNNDVKNMQLDDKQNIILSRNVNPETCLQKINNGLLYLENAAKEKNTNKVIIESEF